MVFRNPAKQNQLRERELKSHYFLSFIYPRWCRISSINSRRSISKKSHLRKSCFLHCFKNILLNQSQTKKTDVGLLHFQQQSYVDCDWLIDRYIKHDFKYDPNRFFLMEMLFEVFGWSQIYLYKYTWWLVIPNKNNLLLSDVFSTHEV